MSEPKPLKPKQLVFCQEYLLDLNATRAAIRAGYSTKAARLVGPRLMQNDAVKSKILQLMDERARRCAIKSDEVLAELAVLAFSRITDVVQWDSAGTITILPSKGIKDLAAIAKISNKDGNISVTMRDKVRPLIALGNHLGLFGHLRGRGTSQDLPEGPEAHKEDEKWPKRLITLVPDGSWEM